MFVRLGTLPERVADGLMSAQQAVRHKAAEKPAVFIVDDDAAVRAGLSLLVRSCGWEPRPCESAEAFLRSYDRRSPGCLLLDLHMPGMSGVDLQEMMGDLDVRLPVIVVTAHMDHPMARRAREAGARAVIGKPFRNEELVQLIQDALAEAH